MRPQRWTVGVVVVGAAVVVVAAVAAVVAVIVISPGMILCFQNVRFSCFWKRHEGWMDGRTNAPTDLQTYGQMELDPLIEMRGRI